MKAPISFSSCVALATASSSMPREVTSPVWFCSDDVARLSRRHVLAFQVEDRGREIAVESLGRDLHADFGLLAGLRQEQLVRAVEADDRVVARRVGDVGRDAVVEIVDQARAPAELAVVAAGHVAPVSRAACVVSTQSLRPLSTSVKLPSFIWS